MKWETRTIDLGISSDRLLPLLHDVSVAIVVAQLFPEVLRGRGDVPSRVHPLAQDGNEFGEKSSIHVPTHLQNSTNKLDHLRYFENRFQQSTRCGRDCGQHTLASAVHFGLQANFLYCPSHPKKCCSLQNWTPKSNLVWKIAIFGKNGCT